MIVFICYFRVAMLPSVGTGLQVTQRWTTVSNLQINQKLLIVYQKSQKSETTREATKKLPCFRVAMPDMHGPITANKHKMPIPTIILPIPNVNFFVTAPKASVDP